MRGSDIPIHYASESSLENFTVKLYVKLFYLYIQTLGPNVVTGIPATLPKNLLKFLTSEYFYSVLNAKTSGHTTSVG